MITLIQKVLEFKRGVYIVYPDTLRYHDPLIYITCLIYSISISNLRQSTFFIEVKVL